MRARHAGAPRLGLPTLALVGLLACAPAASAHGGRPGGTLLRQSPRVRALQMYRDRRAPRGHALLRGHRRRALARAAVVGGTQDTISQIPWQVAVFAKFEANGKRGALLCGGSIIDLTHIVTAGHCTYNPVNGETLPAANFVVLAGASTITEQEIEHGATVQARLISAVRRHPYYNYGAGPGTPDDVAVLTVGSSLAESAAVQPIALPSAQLMPPEGTAANLSGYGAESANGEELNEKLYSLGTTLESSGVCAEVAGTEAEADFLCGRSTGGSACLGDSGGALTDEIGGTNTLVGVVDFLYGLRGEPCRDDTLNGFVNVTAPEIRDFIEGNESPPVAPRGGVALLRGEPLVGQSLTCEPSRWRNGPTFTYAFVNNAHGEVLQQGSSPTYPLTEADIGRSIVCRLTATTAGGIATARSSALSAIARAPSHPSPPTPPAPSTHANPPANGGSEEGLPSQGVAALTITEISALLRHELTPTGRAARLARVLNSGGYTIVFTAPEAGTAVVAWYLLPSGAKLSGNHSAKPLLVAYGRLSFAEAGRRKLKIKLTAAGKALFGHARKLALTAKGTFTPRGQKAISATKRFVLG